MVAKVASQRAMLGLAILAGIITMSGTIGEMKASVKERRKTPSSIFCSAKAFITSKLIKLLSPFIKNLPGFSRRTFSLYPNVKYFPIN